MLQTDAGQQAAIALSLSAAATQLVLRRCELIAKTAGAVKAIYCGAAADQVEISDCIFNGDWSGAVVLNDTAAMTNVKFLRNYVMQDHADAVGPTFHANTTGMFIGNHIYVVKNVAAGEAYVAAAMFKSENYTNEAAHVVASSQVDPAAGGYA